MKYINTAKKFAKRGAATVAVAAFSGAAFATTEPVADPFSAIELSGVAVKNRCGWLANCWYHYGLQIHHSC